ncbi:MAG: hypothetical protein KQJ78_18515 [Deltaproteobacteria bacterium]|nr:hypothetical protein [Deltaproteobacteria bacterium]
MLLVPKPGPGWRLAAVGQLDGADGPDLLWQHQGGSLLAWIIHAAGRLREAAPGGFWPPGRGLLEMGDYGGDGGDKALGPGSVEPGYPEPPAGAAEPDF